MNLEKAKFLNKKENDYGVYYSGKIGNEFINIYENKDGTLKVKIGKEIFIAKEVKSGKGHIATIDGDQYFFGTGTSKFGEYMKMAKLPPRDGEGETPTEAPKAAPRASKPADKQYYGGKKFKS